MKFQRTLVVLLFPSSFFSFWCKNVQARTEEKGLVCLVMSGIVMLSVELKEIQLDKLAMQPLGSL